MHSCQRFGQAGREPKEVGDKQRSAPPESLPDSRVGGLIATDGFDRDRRPPGDWAR
ncbi:hypothetical protein ACFYXC_40635 [Streptomyces sp. NPDC002701]|uniref:hypothetical protein n=1 Tax=Streptomyces sp. NPDC002701 TaxID=3364661 RepID=UPI0036753C51